MTLADFLLARIAEDEAASWHDADCATTGGPPGPFPCDCSVPARVLAECEAKRQIVALHTATGRDGEWPTHECPQHTFPGHPEPEYAEQVSTGLPDYCETLALLAIPYFDHPDYDEGWRP